ncbi:unnamed protein product, partial [Bodo saltans]
MSLSQWPSFCHTARTLITYKPFCLLQKIPPPRNTYASKNALANYRCIGSFSCLRKQTLPLHRFIFVSPKTVWQTLPLHRFIFVSPKAVWQTNGNVSKVKAQRLSFVMATYPSKSTEAFETLPLHRSFSCPRKQTLPLHRFIFVSPKTV